MLSFKMSGLSSRVKYLLVVLLTILPFSAILVFVGLFAYLPTFKTMDKTIDVVMEELVPLSSLQRSLLDAAMPPNDYIIHQHPEEKHLFEEAGKKVEEAFSQLRISFKEHPQQYEKLVAAHIAWQKAFEDGLLLMDHVDNSRTTKSHQVMEVFDADIEVVVDLVNEQYEVTWQNLIDKNAEVATMKYRGIVITVLAFILALSLGILGSVWLTRRNRSLEDQSMHDQLTGAYNRRACDRMLERLTRTTLSVERQLFSLIMLDIDHFKRVNDTYGHQAGDEALKTISHLVCTHLRDEDFFARMGGEEFLIVVHGATKENAEKLANRLRQHIYETTIKTLTDESIKLTASFGVSEFPGDATSHEELIHQADIALYQAKETGRNRVVSYTKP